MWWLQINIKWSIGIKTHPTLELHDLFSNKSHYGDDASKSLENFKKNCKGNKNKSKQMGPN